MKRPISPSLSPNLERKDVLETLRLLCSPWRYTRGNGSKRLEQWFRQYFAVPSAVSFDSCRSALLASLKAIGITAGDHVAIQAFTCVAVPNAVIAAGALPVYVDITSSFSIDIDDLLAKLTPRTKAIIVQHTFNVPNSAIENIVRLGKERSIIVIEDCSHGIGEVYKKKKLGQFGDVAVFSFGRDKAFSSVFGGVAIAKHKEIGDCIRTIQKGLPLGSFWWVLQQLMHPLMFSVILPVYNRLFFGKLFLVVLQYLRVLSFPVTPDEKAGKVPVMKKMTNALSELALFQLKRLSQFNVHRQSIVKEYLKTLGGSIVEMPVLNPHALLRFPVLADKRDEIVLFLKRRKIYAGTWYGNIIDPAGVDMKKIRYRKGLCPNAERLSRRIINLPTYPTLSQEDAREIVSLMKEYARLKRSNQ